MKTLRKKIENCLWYDEDNDQTEFVVDNIEKLIIKEKKKLIKDMYQKLDGIWGLGKARDVLAKELDKLSL